MLQKWFDFSGRHTNLHTEVLAGVTTFVAMVYIVILNPTVLSQGGIDFGGAYIATIVSILIGTLIMGVAANYPIAIAPGIGTNAYFVFVVILSHGTPWQEALGDVMVASTIFLILSMTAFRQILIDSIPEPLKIGIAAGIGLFITLLGLENGRLIVGSPTTITMLGDLTEPVAFLTVLGLVITLALMAYQIRGAIFLGMIAVAAVALALGFLAFPTAPFSLPEGLNHTFCQMSFVHVMTTDQLLVMFTILLVTLFDTTGTMLGVGKQAGLIKDGKFPHLQSALMADSVASFFGALFGTGPTSSYVESGAGVAAGGRTGFASVVTALLFALMIFCTPTARALSSMPAVTAPALIIVGFLMMEGLRSIHWNILNEAFPAFITMIVMPLSYSITTGIGAGFILYTLLKLFSGEGKTVHPMMYLFSCLFVLQFVFIRF